MANSRKGRVVMRRKCRVCGGAKEPGVGKVCGPCLVVIGKRSGAARAPAYALVRRLHQLRLRASAGLPLFP
jgi:cytochrome c2